MFVVFFKTFSVFQKIKMREAFIYQLEVLEDLCTINKAHATVDKVYSRTMVNFQFPNKE